VWGELVLSGKCEVESGKCRVKSAEWKVESGKREVESGKWKVRIEERGMINELCHSDRATQESRFIGKESQITKSTNNQIIKSTNNQIIKK